MLGKILKRFLTPRSSGVPGGGAQSPADDTRSALLQAAQEDARLGRLPEAIAGCKAALELDPDCQAAHALLAAIDLPGEDYFRLLGRIHAHLRPRTYVEIGVAKGDSIRRVSPETRVLGVDTEPAIKFKLPSNVKIFASHAGVTVGGDGATHQMLEDVSLMRGLPNFRVIVPVDEIRPTRS